MAERIFLSDRYPGWYVRLVEDNTEVTFGPFSEAECDAVLAMAKQDGVDEEALDEAFKGAKMVIMVKLEGVG